MEQPLASHSGTQHFGHSPYKSTEFRTMKTTFSRWLLPLFLTLCLSACAGKSPKSVAERYLTAIQVGDYKGAQQFASAESQEPLAALAEQKLPVGDHLPKFEMGEEVISGERAVVEFKQDGNPHLLSLIQENGEWKVIYAAVDPNSSAAAAIPNPQDAGYIGKLFLEALHSGEVREAMKYATKDAQRALEMVNYNYKRSQPDHIKILDVKQNEQYATVHYTKNDKERWLEMVKEHDEWKAEWKHLNDDTFDDLFEQVENATGH
jgi:hypothetical protein